MDTGFLDSVPDQDLFRLLMEMDGQLADRGLFKCTGDFAHDLDAYRAFLEAHACVNLEVANQAWQPVVEHLLLEAFKRLLAPTNIRSGTAPYGDDSQAVFACQHWYIVAAQKVFLLSYNQRLTLSIDLRFGFTLLSGEYSYWEWCLKRRECAYIHLAFYGGIYLLNAIL